MSDQPFFPTRRQMAKQFGMDCPPVLEWKGWQPGGDFVRNLVLKNVSNNVLKIRYKLPTTKLFYMGYPETIVLSPGMQYNAPVSFRPIENREYTDKIEVEVLTLGKSFFVKVKAVLPHISVDVQKELDLGCCTVAEITKTELTIRNTGELPAPFFFRFSSPFSVHPQTGTIPAGQTQKVRVSICPLEAGSFETSISCTIDNIVYPTEVRALSKYPFIRFSEPEVHFGKVLCGRKRDIQVDLINQSNVDATVTFKRDALDRDFRSPFTVHPQDVRIPANSSIPITITFQPLIQNCSVYEKFTYRTLSGCVASLTCKGQGTGPHIQISSEYVYFGDVKLGESARKIFTLFNYSESSSLFQFQYDNSGSFKIDKLTGSIPAGFCVEVACTFTPTDTINYCDKMFILLENQSPLNITFVGTSFDENTRPAPLEIEHIEQYAKRCKLGLALVEPSSVKRKMEDVERVNPILFDKASKWFTKRMNELTTRRESAANGDDKDQDNKNRMRSNSTVIEIPEIKSIPMTERNEMYHGLFNEHSRSDALACIVENEIDFGEQSASRMGEYKVVTVRNQSSGRLTCVWDQSSTYEEGGSAAPVFVVFPPSQTLRPGESVEFKVAFRPKKQGYYYSRQLKCYCFHKENRSFRLVDNDTFTPPVSLSVLAIGHTFVTGYPHFLPTASFSFSSISFRPTIVGQEVFQTGVLRNRSDTPMVFRFKESNNRDFVVHPQSGLIPKQKFCLISFCFRPKDIGTFRHNFECVLNASQTDVITIPAVGHGDSPSMVVQEHISFKPTSKGLRSRKTCEIQNPTRISVQYEIRIREKDENVLRVSSLRGVLLGGEKREITWEFSPKEISTYKMRAIIAVWAEDDDLEDKTERQYPVQLSGECRGGILEFSPKRLEFGSVQIDQSSMQALTIRNTSDCSLKYELFAKPLHAVPNPRLYDNAITFSERKGSIPARTRKTLTVCCRMTEIADASFVISALLNDSVRSDLVSPRAIEYHGTEEEASSGMVCIATVSACVPQPRITDVRKEACDPRSAWRMFDTDSINHALAGGLNDLERSINNNETDQRSLTVEELVQSSDPHILNFGEGELSSPPEVAYIQLENTGTLPVTWSIDLPRNESKEKEHWTDAADMSFHQLKQDAIMEHKLFTVEPMNGVIPVEGIQIIRFAYGHRFSGEFTLPAMMDIVGGKKLPLLFKASTVARLPPYLSLPPSSRTHVLQPLALGVSLDSAPVQFVPLVNSSTFDLEYQVDMKSFEKSKADNFGFSVFQCLNPTGKIPAGTEQRLEVIFCPIENKEYILDVPISVRPISEHGSQGMPMALQTTEQRIMLKGKVCDSNVPSQYSNRIVRSMSGGIEAALSQAKDSQGYVDTNIEYTEVNGVRVAVVSQPISQTLFIPGQLVDLSSEIVEFGSVSTHSESSRIVIMNNRSSGRVSFVWSSPAENARGDTPVVNVVPRTGTLEAGQSKVFRVNLSSGSLGSVLDRLLSCQIISLASSGQKAVGKIEQYDTSKLVPGQKLKQKKGIEKAILESGIDTYGHAHIVAKTLGNRVSVVDRVLAGQSQRGIDVNSYSMFWPEKQVIKHPFSDCLTSPESYDVVEYVSSLENRKHDQVFMYVKAVVLSPRQIEIASDQTEGIGLSYVPPAVMRSASAAKEQDRQSGARSTTPEGKPRDSETIDRAALRSIMEELVQDSLSHPLTRKALQSDVLLPEPVPYFQQLSSDADRPTAGVRQIFESSSSSSSATTKPSSSSSSSSSSDQMDEASEDGSKTHDVLAETEMERVAESVLEKTFFNLMCEANAGEFKVTVPPRTILLSGVQVQEDHQMQ